MEDGARATFTREQHALLIAHYRRVAPLLAASFAGTPLVAGFVPDWATKVIDPDRPGNVTPRPHHVRSRRRKHGAVAGASWRNLTLRLVADAQRPFTRRLRTHAVPTQWPRNDGDGEGERARNASVVDVVRTPVRAAAGRQKRVYALSALY